MVNLLVMILSGLMPVSLMFPIISAGGIVAIFVISLVFYKEKLSRLQIIGYILGTVSVVLLNI
jgi:multidrug transporter EmrE-like cation transporter